MEQDRLKDIAKPFSFFGLKYNLFDEEGYKDYVNFVVKSKTKSIIFGYSLLLLPDLKNAPELFLISDTFDFFVIDGRGLYSLMKYFKLKSIFYCSLPDIVNLTLEIANTNKYSLLLFGATEEVNQSACRNIRIQYPKINLLEGINGYYDKDNEDSILNLINEKSPDIILIGISSPMKEKLAIKLREKIDCKVIIPCGGVIDVLGGKTKREPKIVRDLNLTAFYRFLQEPKRLFKSIIINYIKVLLIFIPAMFFNIYILRNKNFSIPRFYGIK
jgi:N-acetylglucosaminyldiphosphoundecaprenol N-acetyl-beta-D-mannosaminyltransferase